MAWIVRYKDAKTGKFTRARTLKNPRGVFLKADAEAAQGKLKAKGISSTLAGVSVAVPAPTIAYADLATAPTGNRKQVIVLHSTEGHDRPGLDDVRGVLGYLEDIGYGVHYVVDGEGNVGRGAKHEQIVSHAKGANSFGIGIEQVGFAAWDTRRWLWDKWSVRPEARVKRQQLRTVSHLIAYIADLEGIPIKLSTTHGIAMHSSYKAGGHVDPGPAYPINWVIKEAAKIQKQWRGKG